MTVDDTLQVPGVEKGSLRDNLEVLAFAMVIIFFFKTFVAQQFKIPTGSMRETLMIGDHLLINKFIFAPAPSQFERTIAPLRSVQRGDIITFRWPLDRDQDYVKRAVGLPGDTLEIINKRLYVNGHLVAGSFEHHTPQPTLDEAGHQSGAVLPGPWPPERFAGIPSPGGSTWPFVEAETLSLNRQGMQSLITDRFVDNLPLITIPPGYLFAMGDNRDNSMDSRYWGFVPIDHLRGRPFLIWWSFREGAQDYENGRVPNGPWDVLIDMTDAVRFFFTRTRWERTGMIPR
jgi:signal peptidase I